MNYRCIVAFISCFVICVVGCGGGDKPQEKQSSTTSDLVTGAESPGPGAVCTENDLFDTNCNTPPPAWQYIATQDCGSQGKGLEALALEGACPNGAAVHAHYRCCGPQ